MGLSWNTGADTGQTGRLLEVCKVTGNTPGLKTLRRETIQHEGVKLSNALPNEIQNFSGKVETFKCLLDDFLLLIDNKPETESLKSPIVDCEGVSTNSLYYWCLKTSTKWKPKLPLAHIGHCFLSKDLSVVCRDAQLNHL